MCPNRLHAIAATTALLSMLAMPVSTHAQSSMDLPGDTSSMGGAMVVPQQGQRARSVFFGTIAALLAQSLGTSLSQGLSTSITQWFERAKSSEQPVRTLDAPGHAVGVAYEVHVLERNGGSHAVDRGGYWLGDDLIRNTGAVDERQVVQGVAGKRKNAALERRGDVAGHQVPVFELFTSQLSPHCLPHDFLRDLVGDDAANAPGGGFGRKIEKRVI